MVKSADILSLWQDRALVVRPGDRIVAVNGARGDGDLLFAALQEGGQRLELSVWRAR